jgi:hypothetical protein
MDNSLHNKIDDDRLQELMNQMLTIKKFQGEVISEHPFILSNWFSTILAFKMYNNTTPSVSIAVSLSFRKS